MIEFPPALGQRLRDTHVMLSTDGTLLSPPQAHAASRAFRDHFGPQALLQLSGPDLLERMHGGAEADAMNYWLEFKNDNIFPGRKFGSIAGGSSQKFGVFLRSGTRQWVNADNREITGEEAIRIATRHRDELLACAAILEKLTQPALQTDAEAATLQAAIHAAAPTLSQSGWAHKYLCLLFPDLLDNHHNPKWQRHHLLKLLEMPPAEHGHYTSAARYLRIAAHFGWPLMQLTATLNACHGGPVRYWRLGTEIDGIKCWPTMRAGGYAAVGWCETGDLGPALLEPDIKTAIKDLIDTAYPGYSAGILSRKAGEVRDFASKIQPGDVILAGDGHSVVGIGTMAGPYRYQQDDPVPAAHRRDVAWHDTGATPLFTTSRGHMTTVAPITDEEVILQTEQILAGVSLTPASVPTPNPVVTLGQEKAPVIRLTGIPGEIQTILERKGQVIFYGPPGTGKTYWARRSARDLAALSAFRKTYDQLTAEGKAEIDGRSGQAGLFRSCTFHPAYGYEDFMEGYRPATDERGQLRFERRTGIFKALCEAAASDPGRNYYLHIDEINRGDIPRIFGELLTLLEMDKRGTTLLLPLSGDVFSVPGNVRIIATMNTADRSIALLDVALRRRFGFHELMPDPLLLGPAEIAPGLAPGRWLGGLNDRIRTHLGRDGRHLQIGHAYFLEGAEPVTDWEKFARILQEDIVPLLEEYCYENYRALAQILGTALVDEQRQEIRRQLFIPAARPELLAALLHYESSAVATTGGNFTGYSADYPLNPPDTMNQLAPLDHNQPEARTP